MLHVCVEGWLACCSVILCPFILCKSCLVDASTPCIAYCSEELDAKSLKVILGNLAPRMGAMWDFIGIQLRQGELVKDLRSLSSTEGSANLQRIIEEWFENADQRLCCEC